MVSKKIKTESKCLYCGLDHHTSKTIVCDMLTLHPLPFKISEVSIPFVTKDTEVLKLITFKTK